MDFINIAMAKDMIGPTVTEEDYKYVTSVIYESDTGIVTRSLVDLYKDGDLDILDFVKPYVTMIAYTMGSLDCYNQSFQAHTEVVSAVIDTRSSHITLVFKCDDNMDSVITRFDVCCKSIVTSGSLNHNGYCNFWIPINKLIDGYIFAHLYIWVDAYE